MNIGQILETHLGWAAAHGVFARRRRGRQAARAPINAPNPRPIATPVFDGATVEDVDEALDRVARRRTPTRRSSSSVDQKRPAGPPLLGQGAALQRPHRRALRAEGHRRLHVHPEAAPPRRRQDPRALDRPVLARHPAAAGRQGAVRRPALRRDGGLGARGVRRRLHAAGDAHHQVRRHGRPRQGLRGDRQGREHRRAVDPRVVQGAAEGDAVASRSTSTCSPTRAARSRCARRTTSCSAPRRSSASTSRPARSARRRASRRPRRSRRAQDRVDEDGELALPADEALGDLDDVERRRGARRGRRPTPRRRTETDARLRRRASELTRKRHDT